MTDPLDRHLDELWDRFLAEDGVEPAVDRPLALDAATIRELHQRDGAPFPSSSFVRQLREELMSQAAASRPQAGPITPILPNGARPRPGPTIAHPRSSPNRRWPAVMELTALAAVVALLLGTAFGGRSWLNGIWATSTGSPGERAPVGMFRGDAGRTGVMPGPGPAGEPGLRWRAPLDGPLTGAAPIVAGGRLYMVLNEQGRVGAFDPGRGGRFWSANVGAISGSHPAVGNGLVYLATAGPEFGGSDAGFLVALDAETGTERWRYPTGGSVGSSPALADDKVFVTAVDGSLRAVDDLTGREVWRFDLAGAALGDANAEATPGASTIEGEIGLLSPVSPAIAGGLVYTATSDGDLFAIDVKTGREKWRFATDGNHSFTPTVRIDPDTGNGIVVFIGSFLSLDEARGHSRWVYALDARSGEMRWQREIYRDPYSALVLTGDQVLIAGVGDDGPAGGRSLVALDPETGDELWTFTANGAIRSSPVVASAVAYVTSADGFLHAIDVASGNGLWRVEVGWAFSGIGVADGAVFLATLDLAPQGGWLLAIGGSETRPGTPAATPAPGGDLTGRPPCVAPPRDLATLDPTGEPASSLVPPRDGQEHGQPAQILLSEIPDGQPASPEAIAGIRQTLVTLLDCLDPGDLDRATTLYSDDFFRRAWVRAQVQQGNLPIWFMEAGRLILAFEEPRAFADGRVGIFIKYSDIYSQYLVFVERDGRWLIDEFLEVVPTLGLRG